MNDKKKRKLKKFYFHPITTFLFLSILLIVLSQILSAFQMQATYNTINENTHTLDPILIAVEGLFNFKEIKYILSNSLTNFLSFAPLGTLLISLVGLSIAEGTGLIEVFSKRYLNKIPNWLLTLIVLFLGISSSLINEVGYSILIPMFALIYFINGRNPILGIVTSFCGIAFGYGISIFVGSLDISLLDYTSAAAHLIDDAHHVALSSNLIYIIVSSIITSIIGTIH